MKYQNCLVLFEIRKLKFKASSSTYAHGQHGTPYNVVKAISFKNDTKNFQTFEYLTAGKSRAEVFKFLVPFGFVQKDLKEMAFTRYSTVIKIW